VPDDDRALMERLAALEAEVKQDADAQRARKEAAMAKVREERAKAEAEKADLRSRQAALVRRQPAAEPEPSVDDDEDRGVFERLRRRDSSEADHADGLGGAIELAGKANRLKGELAKTPQKGEKSWMKSGLLSLFFGPVGWLYAGSWREAVPASAGWLLFLAVMSKLSIFSFLFIPILAVLMPLSGIAGAVYALSYNRKGKRQRLFGEDKKKLLPEKSGK